MRRGGRAAGGSIFVRLVALLTTVLVVVAGSPAAGQTPPPAPRYTNPLIAENAPDPTIIRAQDGYFYLYATSTYLQGDPRPHTLPIFRSLDMVDWTHVGDVFDGAPEWISTPVGAWAPDVHFMNGRYYLYYSTSQAKALPRYGSPAGTYAIGVATAPTPTGPWTDAGPSAGGPFETGPIVPPKWGWCTDPANRGCYDWVIDSHVYQGKDGTRYLYEGSYFGGNRFHELAADGLSLAPGTTVQYGHQIRYEGSMLWPHLVGRDRYYYLIGSQSNCCEGANTPYSVATNRGNQPYGNQDAAGARSNFVDHNNLPMHWMYGPPPRLEEGGEPWGWPGWWNLAGMAGGYPTLRQNGNGVVGGGHQALIEDLAGQDWLFYHGVRETAPWGTDAGQTEGGLRRQLYLDRMDWTADGWPLVNNGDGPIGGGPAPVVTPLVGDNFNRPGASPVAAPPHRGDRRVHWRDLAGRWRTQPGDGLSGGHVRQLQPYGRAFAISRDGAWYRQTGVRAECDLRAVSAGGRYGCALTIGPGAARVETTVDAATGRLSLVRYDVLGRPDIPVTGSVPAGFDLRAWNHLVLELDPAAPGGPTVTATLQNSDRNPMVDLFLTVPDRPGPHTVRVAMVTQDATADFDNVALTHRAPHVADMSPPPAAGPADPDRSDTFAGTVGPQWSWLRPDPALRGFAPSGALELTTNGHLDAYQRINADRENPPALPLTRNVLLQDAPDGDFMAETRLHFDPHTDNLSAGIAAYRDDDHHVSNLVSWNGMMTQIVSIRNTLTDLPAGATCPLDTPVPGAHVATTQYSPGACPPRSEHHSQEYPAALRCCWDGNGRADDPSRVTVHLRLYRQGEVITPWYSFDGTRWFRENAWSLPPIDDDFPLKIALYASGNHKANDSGAKARAWFDYVRVHPVATPSDSGGTSAVVRPHDR